MPNQTRIVTMGLKVTSLYDENKQSLKIPEDWELLPPGDAKLTRKVKSLGPSWTIQQKKGRKTFSKGVWAPKENIAEAKAQVEATRQDPNYQKKLERSRELRAEKEVEYREDFNQSLINFLNFHSKYSELAQKMAKAITEHATPVGSGTVARTKRIPIAERAEAATIAWMRHQTSAYDRMMVPRVAGARREVRQKIAARSREVLNSYRRGLEIDKNKCPLYLALNKRN